MTCHSDGLCYRIGSDFGRSTEGLVALYRFDDGGGSLVRDRADYDAPNDLRAVDERALSWQPGSLTLDKSTVLTNGTNPSKIAIAAKATNELTVEAWLSPRRERSSGPARIAVLSDTTWDQNFVMGQGEHFSDGDKALWSHRVRTTDTDEMGYPMFKTPDGTVDRRLTHLVYTRSADGSETYYIDGDRVANSRRAGSFANWDTRHTLKLGNEDSQDRPWRGTFHMFAVFDRALTAEDVRGHFAIGADPELN